MSFALAPRKITGRYIHVSKQFHKEMDPGTGLITVVMDKGRTLNVGRNKEKRKARVAQACSREMTVKAMRSFGEKAPKFTGYVLGQMLDDRRERQRAGELA